MTYYFSENHTPIIELNPQDEWSIIFNIHGDGAALPGSGYRPWPPTHSISLTYPPVLMGVLETRHPVGAVGLPDIQDRGLVYFTRIHFLVNAPRPVNILIR